MHFFHPAQQMPLVEVVRRRATPPDVIAAVLALAKAMRKTPVLVLNCEGFVVNRLFVPYLKEAFWLLEEGAEPEAVDRAMTDFGFAMGPLRLIDMSGLDILVSTVAILERAFPQHGRLSPIVEQLVARGYLGQKSGAGVYSYEPGDRTPRRHEMAAEIITAVRAGRAIRPLADEQIVRRLMLRMVVEAFCLIEEGIVERPADIDVALVLGTGLADFRGGVLRYASDLGLKRVLDELQQLSGECGLRYAPCPLLEKAAKSPLPKGEGSIHTELIRTNQQGF
jgi:3-hydroxyacyl-CoA dehydrogenase